MKGQAVYLVWFDDKTGRTLEAVYGSARRGLRAYGFTDQNLRDAAEQLTSGTGRVKIDDNRRIVRQLVE